MPQRNGIAVMAYINAVNWAARHGNTSETQ
jgi:hypothetical protein